MPSIRTRCKLFCSSLKKKLSKVFSPKKTKTKDLPQLSVETPWLAVFRNALPYSLSFKILDSVKEEDCFTLDAGGTSASLKLKDDQTVVFSLDYMNSTWTIEEKVSSLAKLDNMEFKSEEGLSLQLGWHKNDDEFIIFSPFWITNESDYELSYLQFVKGQASQRIVQNYHVKESSPVLANFDIGQLFLSIADPSGKRETENSWARLNLSQNSNFECIFNGQARQLTATVDASANEHGKLVTLTGTCDNNAANNMMNTGVADELRFILSDPLPKGISFDLDIEANSSCRADSICVIDDTTRMVDNDREMSEGEFMAKIRLLSKDGNPEEKYRFEEKLGEGSWGVVFKATEKSTGQTVAIKITKFHDPDMYKFIIDEIIAMKICKHKNVINFLECYLVVNKIWIVMEYMAGGTLASVAENNPMSEDLIATICRDILLAIEYAHSNNIIHRDVKSENVLLGFDGTVKLADFGICAHLKPERKKRNTFCGTPDYMAPELAAEKDYTMKVDFWGLGVVAYELKYGQPPYDDQVVSPVFRDFLASCLEATTSYELLKHPFLKTASPLQNVSSWVLNHTGRSMDK